MAMRILKPLVRWGGYYPSKKYTPLVYPGGYTTMDAAIGPLDPLNTFSGDIVRFITKRGLPMQSLKVNMSPKQDLHGYDSPWPEGGSKNLLKLTVESAKSLNNSGVWNGNSYTKTGITFTLITDESGVNVLGVKVNGTSTAITDFILASYDLPTVETAVAYVLSGCPSGGGITSYYLDFRNDNNVQIRDTGDKAAIYSTGQTGRYSQIIIAANYTASNLIFYPMIRLSTEAVDYAPYSNICPISGWTGCEVWRTGKNLGIVKNLYVGGASGLAIGNDGVLICFSAVKGQTYRIGGASGNRNNLYKFRGKMEDIKAGASMSASVSAGHLPVVLTADETCIYCYYRNNTWSDTIANALMVVVGDEAQPYEPYNGNSYSVTFPSVNVWDEEWENGNINSDGIPISVSNSIRSKNFCPVSPGKTYYVTCGKTDGGNQNRYYIGIYLYDEDKNFIGRAYCNNLTFTAPENARYFKLATNTSTVVYGDVYNNDITVNYPSIIRGYHAHTEPMEVYGAEPDLIGGEMPITKAKYTFTWGNYLAEYAPQGSQFKRRTFQLPATLVEGAGHSTTNCLGAYSTQVPTTTPYFYVSNPYAYFWLPPDTPDDFTIELCGELATPTETEITPTPITALNGYNNVWSNAGPVEVTAYGTAVVEPDVQPLQALNLLLGGAYRNDQTEDDVSDEEALDIVLGGADR